MSAIFCVVLLTLFIAQKLSLDHLKPTMTGEFIRLSFRQHEKRPIATALAISIKQTMNKDCLDIL